MASKQNKPVSTKAKPAAGKNPLPAKEKPVTKNTNATGLTMKFITSKTAMAILAVAALLAFIGALGNDFVSWDDNVYITSNPYIQSPTFANLLKLLMVECSLNFHPLTMASLWLNALLSGATSPVSFIITNIIIHACNTILVFVLAQKLANENIFIAFFTALLWGVHPMHAESVAWISERKDVLYSFFFFLSCIQYINYLQKGNSKFWIYSLAFFLLSCLAKGMAVVLPLVLVLIDYWFYKKPFAYKSLINKIPFFIISLLFGLIAINIQSGGNLGGYVEKLTDTWQSALIINVDLLQRIRFSLYSFSIYIIKMFIPYHQHNYYPYPFPGDYNNLQYTIAPILAVALLIWVAVKQRKQKIVFFGVMFFFFTISIVLQFLAVGVTIVSERYTYIPYFGLIFIIVYWLNDKIGQQKLVPVFSVISLVFIFLSYQQTKPYKNTLALFLNSYEYEKGPSLNGMIYEKICNQYGLAGNYEEAVHYGEEALANNVESWKLHEILADGYFFTKNINKSLQSWNKALQSCPDREKKTLFTERGRMLRVIGNYAQSEADFDSTLKYLGQNNTGDKGSSVAISEIYYEKGLTEKLAGSYKTARDDFNKAMQLNAAMATTYLKEKALTECYTEDWSTAISDYTTLINKGISKDTAYGNRGFAKLRSGDKSGAISDWQEALKINPNYAMAKDNLNAALKQ